MKTIARSAIERFIRQELGCQCPAAVFRRIGVEDTPIEFGISPQGRLISVGERLLILVVRSDEPNVVHRMLGNLLLEGRRVRDVRGFSRFRLVIATTCVDVMESTLREDFTRFAERDERLHLHIISPEKLPSILA
jgi:hypothetical protein